MIDYEIVAARVLYMEIEARAKDGRSAITKVRVEVRDDNDNSPKFRQVDNTSITYIDTCIFCKWVPGRRSVMTTIKVHSLDR